MNTSFDTCLFGNYLEIYNISMDTDLNTLDYYPSVWIGKEEFED